MGAGHTVTVLHEIVPAGAEFSPDGSNQDRPVVDPLKYQSSDRQFAQKAVATVPAAFRDELLTVKVRYKQPDGASSSVMEHAVRTGRAQPRDLPFAAAVAEFGLLLRDERAPLARWDTLTRRITALNLDAAAGAAPDRRAFQELVDLAAALRRMQREAVRGARCGVRGAVRVQAHHAPRTQHFAPLSSPPSPRTFVRIMR